MHGGRGDILTYPLHWFIHHFAVIPGSKDTIWSMKITDAEDDVIYERVDHEGRLDDKEGLPVGKDTQQKIRVEFFDTTKNETFKMLIKVRETQ